MKSEVINKEELVDFKARVNEGSTQTEELKLGNYDLKCCTGFVVKMEAGMFPEVELSFTPQGIDLTFPNVCPLVSIGGFIITMKQYNDRIRPLLEQLQGERKKCHE
jgi:hypothetical protein